MPTPTHSERRIALFLDFENIIHDSRTPAAEYDLGPVLARLLEKGKIVYRRAYCDWQRFRGYTQGLHDNGIELVDVPPSTRAGKNGADMRLVIDALELAYARENIDTFAIASGDSDFVPLVNKLRENDRYVIGLGAERQSSSQLFVRSCDEFMYIDQLLGEKRRRPQRGERRGESDKSERPSTPAEPAAPKADLGFIVDVVDALYGDLQRPIAPSAIKDALRRRQPDFDERAVGFKSMTRLLEHLEAQGEIRRVQHAKSDQLYILPAETGAPAEAGATEAPVGSEDDGNDAAAVEAPLPVAFARPVVEAPADPAQAAQWADALLAAEAVAPEPVAPEPVPAAAAPTEAGPAPRHSLLDEELDDPDAPLPGNEKHKPATNETLLGVEKRAPRRRGRRGGSGGSGGGGGRGGSGGGRAPLS